MIRKKKGSPPQKKNTAKKCPAKIYSSIDILVVNINCGTGTDSEDEEYFLEDENTIDNWWIMHQVVM